MPRTQRAYNAGITQRKTIYSSKNEYILEFKIGSLTLESRQASPYHAADRHTDCRIQNWPLLWSVCNAMYNVCIARKYLSTNKTKLTIVHSRELNLFILYGWSHSSNVAVVSATKPRSMLAPIISACLEILRMLDSYTVMIIWFLKPLLMNTFTCIAFKFIYNAA